jgi:hypothetical protein
MTPNLLQAHAQALNVHGGGHDDDADREAYG